jgi:membrane fusion protein (multidrug efflux system)
MTRSPLLFRNLAPVSIALLALTFTACARNADPSSAAVNSANALPAPAVVTTVVETAELAQIRHLPGTVQAVSRATIAAQTMGRVKTARLNLGQQVNAGDTLITLSADALTANVTQAQAALDLATREYQREAALLERGASTSETVSTLEDQRRIATAQLAAATAQLDYTQVTAPFDGMITARHVEPGDFASPGTALFTLEGIALEVQLAVPESLAPATIGQVVPIELDDNHTVSAIVTEASPSADPTTRTRLVRLLLPTSPPANAGQFVRARWPDQPATVIRVPSSAVTAFGQMQRVFVATSGSASLRLVKTGHVQDGETVILSGLNPGETIVLDPPASLRDHQPLNVTATR